MNFVMLNMSNVQWQFMQYLNGFIVTKSFMVRNQSVPII